MENTKSEMLLSLIAPSQSNELFRAKKKLTEEALSELTGSIKQLGVIQPIAIRPDPNKEGHFIIIAGERRYHASGFAGKTTIPAEIFDVTEEVAFEMQLTENLNREDVHALNQAKAYKMILEGNQAMTTKEIALKFGKSETYIVQRLKLNDLVNEAAKDFLADKMMLGHALLLCRLKPADQKTAVTELKRYRDDYGTVNQLQAFIDRNITNDLSKAPFDKKDTNLCTKAGACTLCPKRSGASLLFADIKEKDKCFDRTCFSKKVEVHLTSEVKRIVETEPDVVMLTTRYGKVNEAVSEMLNEHKVKPLVEYDDFSSDKSDQSKKLKGFWISGESMGQIENVYIRAAAASKVEPDSPQVVSEKIVHRMKRNRELDQEKVYAKILAGLKDHATQKKPGTLKLSKDEETFLWFIVWDKAGYALTRELSKKLHIPFDKPDKLVEVIAKLKPEDKAFILRRVMMEQYSGNYPTSAYGIIIKKIAEGYGDIDIKSFEKEQSEICEKRETRQKDKLKQLGASAKKSKKSKKSKSRKVALAA